jgi:hypothetical protein
MLMKGPEKQYQLLVRFWFGDYAASRVISGELARRAVGQRACYPVTLYSVISDWCSTFSVGFAIQL